MDTHILFWSCWWGGRGNVSLLRCGVHISDRACLRGTPQLKMSMYIKIPYKRTGQQIRFKCPFVFRNSLTNRSLANTITLWRHLGIILFHNNQYAFRGHVLTHDRYEHMVYIIRKDWWRGSTIIRLAILFLKKFITNNKTEIFWNHIKVYGF